MPLYTITYISRAPEMRGEQRRIFLGSLVKQADKNNAPYGVSGCLIHVDDYFIQVMEGPRGPLSDTYNRIAQDERHHEVNLVHAGPLVTRQFTSPVAGRLRYRQRHESGLLQIQGAPEILPLSVSAACTGRLDRADRACLRQARQFQPPRQNARRLDMF
jgi:hypothetical protein